MLQQTLPILTLTSHNLHTCWWSREARCERCLIHPNPSDGVHSPPLLFMLHMAARVTFQSHKADHSRASKPLGHAQPPNRIKFKGFMDLAPAQQSSHALVTSCFILKALFRQKLFCSFKGAMLSLTPRALHMLFLPPKALFSVPLI